MATVEATFVSSSKLRRAWMDGEKLKFTKGVARKKVNAGKHRLSWEVRGKPGTTYTIAITKPKEAKCGHKGTLDEDKIDFGYCYFKVSS